MLKESQLIGKKGEEELHDCISSKCRTCTCTCPKNKFSGREIGIGVEIDPFRPSCKWPMGAFHATPCTFRRATRDQSIFLCLECLGTRRAQLLVLLVFLVNFYFRVDFYV